MRLQDVRFKSLSAGLMGTGLLGMLLVTGGTARAQDARDDARPPQQEEPKQEEAKPEEAKPRQDEAKPPKEQAPGKAEDAKPAKDQKQLEKDQKQQEKENSKEMKQNNDARPGAAQDRPMQNNGGDHATRAAAGQGQKIPDDKFRSHFGRQHTFKVQTRVVEGQPRFQYGGYWFALANPWPGDWAYTDDCYIDYIDGEYVLIDLLHPGIEIPVIVVVG